jgi:hypothetical protein
MPPRRPEAPKIGDSLASARAVPDRGTFEREDFERAWHHGAPAIPHFAREATLIVRRSSAHDFQDRQIYLWIDEEPLGKIRYGDVLTRRIEPGRHTVRVFNTLFSRTLTVDVAPGEQVRVQCGTGMPTAGWLLMVILHVTYLRVWVTKDEETGFPYQGS